MELANGGGQMTIITIELAGPITKPNRGVLARLYGLVKDLEECGVHVQVAAVDPWDYENRIVFYSTEPHEEKPCNASTP